MVQEHLEGQTLGDRLESKGLMSTKMALDLAVEIVEALAAAHSVGIVHRDLKPPNIFVSADGHAKILDFGIAKLTEFTGVGGSADSRSPTMVGTVAGQVMGTAGYMAPEQVEGETVDHRADVFAFGCVLYEMITGRRAFVGKNMLDTLHKIANSEPQPLAEVSDQIPADLQRIVRKCLAKEPSARYQTAGDLAVDLRSLATEVEKGTALPLGAVSTISPQAAAASAPKKSLGVAGRVRRRRRYRDGRARHLVLARHRAGRGHSLRDHAAGGLRPWPRHCGVAGRSGRRVLRHRPGRQKGPLPPTTRRSGAGLHHRL